MSDEFDKMAYFKKKKADKILEEFRKNLKIINSFATYNAKKIAEERNIELGREMSDLTNGKTVSDYTEYKKRKKKGYYI